MIDLSNADRKQIENILKQHATDQPYRVLVFGSRATGKARKYSDIDLALIGANKVSPRVSALLAEAFDDSSLPYTVDVVDGNNANEQLLAQIQQHGEELLQL